MKNTRERERQEHSRLTHESEQNNCCYHTPDEECLSHTHTEARARSCLPTGMGRPVLALKPPFNAFPVVPAQQKLLPQPFPALLVPTSTPSAVPSSSLLA